MSTQRIDDAMFIANIGSIPESTRKTITDALQLQLPDDASKDFCDGVMYAFAMMKHQTRIQQLGADEIEAAQFGMLILIYELHYADDFDSSAFNSDEFVCLKGKEHK